MIPAFLVLLALAGLGIYIWTTVQLWRDAKAPQSGSHGAMYFAPFPHRLTTPLGISLARVELAVEAAFECLAQKGPWAREYVHERLSHVTVRVSDESDVRNLCTAFVGVLLAADPQAGATPEGRRALREVTEAFESWIQRRP